MLLLPPAVVKYVGLTIKGTGRRAAPNCRHFEPLRQKNGVRPSRTESLLTAQ